MNDVIEVMSDMYESMSGTEIYRMAMALRAAEAHGWRLVPVEDIERVEDLVADIDQALEAGFWELGDALQRLEAAPRPWDEGSTNE